MRIYIAQMAMSPTTEANVASILRFIGEASQLGCDTVVFPECAVTGYRRSMIEELASPDPIEHALRRIADECAGSRTAAVVGTPLWQDGVWYDGAVVFNHNGDAVTRQGKVSLSKPEGQVFASWAERSTFNLGTLSCSVIFCREASMTDERRNWHMEGSSVIFWLCYYSPKRSDQQGSEEGNVCIEQGTALAKEFGAYVVQANWANATDSPTECLGSSVAISPDGELLIQGRFGEEQGLVLDTANRAPTSRARD